MIDKSKTYRTRDGRDVRIYATDGGGDYPVHGAIEHKDRNKWCAYAWTPTGLAIRSCSNHPFDLVEAKTRVHSEFWVNVYEDRVGFNYLTKAEADKGALTGSWANKRMACIKVVIDCEEGDGL